MSANLSASENAFMAHMRMFGSDGYPVQKVGRKWRCETPRIGGRMSAAARVAAGRWANHAIRKARKAVACVECQARLAAGVYYVAGELVGNRITGSGTLVDVRAAHCLYCAGTQARETLRAHLSACTEDRA